MSDADGRAEATKPSSNLEGLRGRECSNLRVLQALVFCGH